MIKGSHQSLEAKTKISQYQLGRKRSSDTRIKMSTSQKRENLSLEARKNRSIAKRGNKNPMFGKVLSLKHIYAEKGEEDMKISTIELWRRSLVYIDTNKLNELKSSDVVKFALDYAKTGNPVGYICSCGNEEEVSWTEGVEPKSTVECDKCGLTAVLSYLPVLNLIIQEEKI